MSSKCAKPMPGKGGKKQPSRRQAQPAEVQPISPLGLVAAIGAALVIAAILLFVINARVNAPRSAVPAPTPITAPRPVNTNTPAPPSAASTIAVPQGPQLGEFVKGNTQAKVTVVEFGDFK